MQIFILRYVDPSRPAGKKKKLFLTGNSRVFTEYSLLDSWGPGYWDLGYRGYKEAGSQKPEAGTKMNKKNKNKIIMKVMSLILFKLTFPQLTLP